MLDRGEGGNENSSDLEAEDHDLIKKLIKSGFVMIVGGLLHPTGKTQNESFILEFLINILRDEE